MPKHHNRVLTRILSLLLALLLMLSVVAPVDVFAVTTSPSEAIQINRETALNVFIQDTFRYPDVFAYRIDADAEGIMNSLYDRAGLNLMLLLAAEQLDFELSVTPSGAGTLRITPTYYDSSAQRTEVRNYVNETADTLFHSNMSDRERLAAVNRHLVETFAYDQTYTVYSVFPFITKKTGVCQSYAQLGVMLLLAGGLEAYPISGVAGGEKHAWIAVKVNGSWFEFDPTFNDSLGYQDASTRTQYLARTHEEMVQEGRTYDLYSLHTYLWEDGLRQTALPTPVPPSPGTTTPDAPATGSKTGSPYTDIEPGQWYYEAAIQMKSDGLMFGTAGEFLPDGTVTLAQIVTVAARLHARDNHLLDILADATNAATAQKKPWYQGYVDYALAMGIIQGDEFGRLWANRNATREEMAYILQRTVGGLLSVSSVPIPDIGEVNASYVLAVRIMANARIINGVDKNNTFLPAGIATRAQLAVILTRLKNMTPS